MIRLVLGLVLLFLGLSMATVLLVQAVRRKRAAAKLRRPFETRTHAGTESTYWQTKLAPDATKAITRTSGRLPDPDMKPMWHKGDPSGIAFVDEIGPPVADFVWSGVSEPVPEEWRPAHPLPGWQVVKAHGLWFAVPPSAGDQVQRYSRVQMGWVAETHDNLRVAAVLAAIHETTGEA